MAAVSVILLAWNSGELLRPAVDSILRQTMSDLELVIVDDGSTDGSVERLLAERPDPRIKLLTHATNLGIGAGTASALPLCTAPWIAIMDSDDCSHPMRFEMQLKAAEVDPSLDVISTDVEVIDKSGRRAGVWPAYFAPHEMRNYTAFNMPFCHPTMMARAAVFRAVPYRAEFEVAADFDFVTRASEKFKLGAVSLPLHQYRRHPQSVSASRIEQSELYGCVIRLITARRRAGRPEQLADTLAEVRQRAPSAGGLDRLYAHFASKCQAEGFPLLAAFHAALAMRVRSSPGAVFRYLRCTVSALRADRSAWPLAVTSMAKAPFWTLLKRAGFPSFPRY